MIGVDHRGLVKQITRLIPDYMVMGERGMADMAEMEMPLPDNTLPMMAGQGPFGSAEMGGMFTIVKVRADQPRGDYSDPGWYSHPPGTVAYEWTGPLAEATRFASEGGQTMPVSNAAAPPSEVYVRKPNGRKGHAH
jgi:manganese oxidase